MAYRNFITKRWDSSEARHELIVHLETRVAFDLGIDTVDLADMPGGMPAACGAALLQSNLDQGPDAARLLAGSSSSYRSPSAFHDARENHSHCPLMRWPLRRKR